MSFQFGANRPGYLNTVGDIAGRSASGAPAIVLD